MKQNYTSASIGQSRPAAGKLTRSRLHGRNRRCGMLLASFGPFSPAKPLSLVKAVNNAAYLEEDHHDRFHRHLNDPRYQLPFER
jgi:hypothetical protein